MSLLVGVPVILPPDPTVVASWTHRPQLNIVNGAQGEWLVVAHAQPASRQFYWYAADENLGVAASWNMIFGYAAEHGYSHVALMSQGVRLIGGTAHLAELVDEFADWRGLLTDFAFRCVVLSVKLWEQIGPFDSTFHPAYFEDSDYLRRLFLAHLHSPDNPMPKVGRDLLDGTSTEAATLTSGVIDPACYGHNHDLFVAKWHGEPFREKWSRPYDPTSYDPFNNWARYDLQRKEHDASQEPT